MRIRDRLADTKRKDESLVDVPIWEASASDTTKKIVLAVRNEYSRIYKLVESSQKINKPIKIRPAVIAAKCGIDRSTITFRRQPLVIEWLRLLNDRLADLQGSKAAKPNKVSTSKAALLKESAKLKQELQKSERLRLRGYAEHLFDSELLTARDFLAKENRVLKSKIEEVERQNTALLTENEFLKKELNRVAAKLRESASVSGLSIVDK